MSHSSNARGGTTPDAVAAQRDGLRSGRAGAGSGVESGARTGVADPGREIAGWVQLAFDFDYTESGVSDDDDRTVA